MSQISHVPMIAPLGCYLMEINHQPMPCRCKKDVSHFVLTLFPCQNCRWFMLFHPWYIPQYFPGVDLWQPKLSAIERRKFSFLGKAGNKEAKKTVKIKPTISALTPVHFSYVQRVPLFKNLISFFVVEKLHLPNKVFPPAHVVYYMFFH